MHIPDSFSAEQRETIQNLFEEFRSRFGVTDADEFGYVRTPGRTEVAGNHTDHEGGSVIGAAVDRYVHGIFSPADGDLIRIESLGFGPIDVRLDDLAPRDEEQGSSAALVRGMAAQFAERGFVPQAFDAVISSEVPGGSGLSSSAAFELELAGAMNALWAKGVLAPEDMALMAQRVEREWFGKPCGLLDQASVALGGIQHMDFSVPGRLDAQELDFDFGKAGYAICLVAVGADHAALTGEYAAVPAEMQAVARELGHERLGDLPESELIEHFSELRERLGDRPMLRALHYYREERLVTERAQALRAGDMDRFLALTRASGASSAMYLQNVSVAGAPEQPAMVALALAEELAGSSAAARIHGGGFGGTIQVFLPAERAEEFSANMDALFGEGACGIYQIDTYGVRAWRLA